MNNIYDLLGDALKKEIPAYQRELYQQILKYAKKPILFPRHNAPRIMNAGETVKYELPKRHYQIIIDDIHKEQAE